MRIPTVYRKRLSREFSFPIGAEMLSEHLAGVPQYPLLRLNFSNVVSAWKSEFQKILNGSQDYPIITSTLYGSFDVTVYPVKRPLKRLAHEHLASGGLRLLRESMCRHYPPNPPQQAYCKMMFSPTKNSVFLREWVLGEERDIRIA